MQQISSFILYTVLFWKNTAYMLLVFFNKVSFSFHVYAKIAFKSLQFGTGLRKPFWFLCTINSFQNKNTYEHNFNLTINDSCLFNSNLRIVILIKHRQLCSKNVWSKDWFAQAIYHTSKSFCPHVGTCACKNMPLLKRPGLTSKTSLCILKKEMSIKAKSSLIKE